MTLIPVVIALGSNLGDRRRWLRTAVSGLSSIGVSVVRMSSAWETAPVDAPPESGPFLNAIIAGYTTLAAPELMKRLHLIEEQMGRRRRGIPRAPRTIDLDLILYGAYLSDRALRLPHPRFAGREFVLAPLREIGLPWSDPSSGRPLAGMHGEGEVRRVGSLY